jgi:hypothetical protein
VQHSMQLRLELVEPAGSASCVPQVLARLDAEQQAAVVARLARLIAKTATAELAGPASGQGAGDE